jgi:hypothetical protein
MDKMWKAIAEEVSFSELEAQLLDLQEHLQWLRSQLTVKEPPCPKPPPPRTSRPSASSP